MADGTGAKRNMRTPWDERPPVAHSEAVAALDRAMLERRTEEDAAADDALLRRYVYEQRKAAQPVHRLPAPERDPHWTRAAIGVTGVSINLRLPEGSAELVFAAEDLDDLREEGRDLLVARVPAEDLLDLRCNLNRYLPSDPIGPATARMRERLAAVLDEWRRQRDGLPPWRDVDLGSGCHLYAMVLASDVLVTLGIRDETLAA